MNIEQLLEEKKKKLEELKKQRLEKQNNLFSHLSSSKDVNIITSTQDQQTNIEEFTPDIKKIEEEEFSIVKKENSKILMNDEKRPKSIYVKTTTTADLDLRSSVPTEEELTQKIYKSLEKRIRKELEEKYKKLYKESVKEYTELKKSNGNTNDEITTDNEDNVSLEYPTTQVKRVSISSTDSNKILTLHNNCICVWIRSDSNLTLIHKISLYTKINVAIFDINDSDKIITGSESGFVYIFNFKDGSQLRSQIQLESIAALYQSSGSIMIITWNATYTIIAMNLVDVISSPTDFLFSRSFKFSESITLLEDERNIADCYFVNVNNLIVSLFSSKVISVDFGQQKLSLLCDEMNNLPIASLSTNQGRVLVLGLDHSIRIINMTTGLNTVTLVHLPNLTLSAIWLTPSSFISYSINNEFTLWKLQNDKIVKIKDIDVHNDTHLTDRIVTMEVLDPTTLVIGDFKGNVQIFNI